MPRNPFRTLALYAFSLHARDANGIVDYVALFNRLSAVPALQRQTGVGDDTVALTATLARGERWALRFVSGQQGLPPLFYDPATGQESYEDLGTRMVAAASWAFVDPIERLIVVDRRRPGVPANTMARALSHLGRELLGYSGLVVDFNPVPASSFTEELHKFERVRQAAIIVARPNYNWNDSAAELTRYADESNATTAEIAMSAGRGDSLSRTEGIVQDIEQLTTNPIGPVKNLRVVGTRFDELRETTLSLAKHQVRRLLSVPRGAAPTEEREALELAGMDLLDSIELVEPSDERD